MKNKKAILLGDHIVGILVALLCLLVLGYMVYSYFSLLQADKVEMQKAESHMNNIVNEVLFNIQEGETRSYMLYSPELWVLVGWPIYNENVLLRKGYFASGKFVEYTENDIPQVCKDNKWNVCLCLCKYTAESGRDYRGLLVDCNSKNVCKGISGINDIIVNNDINSNVKDIILIDNLNTNKQQLNFKLEQGILKISAT